MPYLGSMFWNNIKTYEFFGYKIKSYEFFNSLPLIFFTEECMNFNVFLSIQGKPKVLLLQPIIDKIKFVSIYEGNP